MGVREHTIDSSSVEETQRIAACLAEVAQPGLVIALDGDLGAGKTHFVQGFAEGLGIADAVTSPTFNVMTAYAQGRMPLYHFDLYRLEDALELEDIAFYDYVESAGVSCVEWARKFEQEIPEDALWLSITTAEDGGRCLTARAATAQAEETLQAWVEALGR